MSALIDFMRADLLQTDAAQRTALKPLQEAIQVRHPGAEALLLYGSCRRQPQQVDGLFDLLVVVSSYRRAHPHRLSAWANCVLPPNVYYLEVKSPSGILRSKYATITRAQLAEKMRSELDSYFWARFSQPSRLIWAESESVIDALAAIRAQAASGFYHRALALRAPPSADDEEARMFWQHALSASYQRELRPEPPAHTEALVAADSEYWQGLTELLRESAAMNANPWASWGWRLRRATGKLLNLLRLIKAASTFTQGVDYLAWKIHRHRGIEVSLTPFMRKHPRLAAVPLAWQLWRKGGLR